MNSRPAIPNEVSSQTAAQESLTPTLSRPTLRALPWRGRLPGGGVGGLGEGAGG